MTKYRYDGPFDEVDVPELGVSVKRGHQVDATGDAAASLDAQADWTRVATPARKRAASKRAAKKTAAKTPSKPSTGDAGQNSEE